MAARHPLQYARILLQLSTEMTKENQGQLLDQFVEYLYREGALRKVPYIVEAYTRLREESEGRERLSVTSATELSASLVRSIQDAFGAESEVTAIIDEGIVGGVVVRKGNTIFDASIQKQVELLQSSLTA